MMTSSLAMQIQKQIDQLPHEEQLTLFHWLDAQLNQQFHADDRDFQAELEALRQTAETNQFDLTAEQLQLFQQILGQIEQSSGPIFGLFSGLVEVSDDFDDPLPDDIIDLFYGSETDEYGLSLSQP